MANGKVSILDKAAVSRLSVVQDSQEILDYKLYDTLAVALGGTALEFTFFQQAQGGAGITYEQTNMRIPGQLQSGEKFVAEKIVVEPLPALAVYNTAPVVADFLAVSHQGYAEFNIGGREYMREPIKNLIGGIATGFASGVNTAYLGGRAGISGNMGYSPVIPSTFSFNVRLVYPAAPVVTATMKLRVQIVGKLIRPRQG